MVFILAFLLRIKTEPQIYDELLGIQMYLVFFGWFSWVDGSALELPLSGWNYWNSRIQYDLKAFEWISHFSNSYCCWTSQSSICKVTCLQHWQQIRLVNTCLSDRSNVLFLSFKILFIFYWRIIVLQNFVVFCQTSTWVSHRYTDIASLLNLPPISLPIPPL